MTIRLNWTEPSDSKKSISPSSFIGFLFTFTSVDDISSNFCINKFATTREWSVMVAVGPSDYNYMEKSNQNTNYRLTSVCLTFITFTTSLWGGLDLRSGPSPLSSPSFSIAGEVGRMVALIGAASIRLLDQGLLYIRCTWLDCNHRPVPRVTSHHSSYSYQRCL